MADNIVAGMFGLTPMQVQQQRQQDINSSASNFAGMNATQRGVMGMYQGGAGLAQAGAGMLGLQDPAMQQAQQNQSMAQGIDLSTPKGLREAAQRFQSTGNMQAAMGLLEKARVMENDITDASYKAALADKALAGQEYERMMAIINDPTATPEQINTAKARIAALNAKMTNSGRQGTQSGQLKSTNKGMVVFDPVSKKLSWPNGAELTPEEATGLQFAQYDSATASAVAQATAGGKAVGDIAGAAQGAVVDAEFTMKTVNRHIDELLAHPGFSSAVGMGLPKAKLLAGSKEAGFAARLAQLEGGAFLQAFTMLKGGGQITEVEGKKATQAMMRMDAATSEAEFRAAAEDYRQALKDGLAKLQRKANLSYTPPTAPSAAPEQPSSPQSSLSFDTATQSGATNPNKIKAMYKAGKLTREQATRILTDMQARGLF